LSGNLYASVSNAGTGGVVEYFAAGGSANLPGTSAFPNQMAVDAPNNLFVTDVGNKNVYEYGPARGAPTLFVNQATGASGVAADAAGNVYVTNGGNSGTSQYAPNGTLLAAVYTTPGSAGIVYSPQANLLFGASAPFLYQIDPTNANPATNFSLVSSSFAGTVYLTVQAVPEPGSVVLAASGLAALIALVWRRRTR
jgi:hypothetical protein